MMGGGRRRRRSCLGVLARLRSAPPGAGLCCSRPIAARLLSRSGSWPACSACGRGAVPGGCAGRGSPMSGSSGGGSGARNRPGASFAINAQARTAA